MIKDEQDSELVLAKKGWFFIMKKNVRIFFAALTMSLCIGGLTGCGKTDEEQLEATNVVSEDVQ